MSKTSIEWTDRSWSPVIGCDPVSPGCRNCWAARMATRHAGNPKTPDYHGLAEGGKWTQEPPRFLADRLAEPLRWRKPPKVAVCLMGDLFHEAVTDQQIAAVFGVMAACPRHTFQVLTKRADRMARWFRWSAKRGVVGLSVGRLRDVYSIWLSELKDCAPVMYTGSESAAAKERSREEFVEGDAKVLIMSLRSGAGLDGLQAVSRTVVFGELDWSPGVHEQCSGRVHRDGQTDPVVAYYLVAETGSDPVVVDVLGLKRQQIEGVRDPDADLVEKLDTTEDRIKLLAEAYLRRDAA